MWVMVFLILNNPCGLELNLGLDLPLRGFRRTLELLRMDFKV